MMEVSKKTFDTSFPLSTEAVGVFRYLVWPERAPSRQKQDRRGPRLPAGRKGHNMNETSSSGSLALWAGSFNHCEVKIDIQRGLWYQKYDQKQCGGIRMEQETKEYLERLLVGLTTKEDLEKLRQETKSNLRQLKEESKNQILEWKQEVKAELEQTRKGEVGQTDPMQKEFRDGIQELKVETQSALDQSFQKIETLLQEIKEVRETPSSDARQGPSIEVSGLKDGIESLKEGIKEVAEEIVYIKEMMKDGFVEVQTELGSMMRFSYADLERKFNALEARIKALEKMVFP